jgi:aminopeptidase C
LGLDSETLKELVIKMIKADRPVWFGCDVGKMSTSTYGIMDTELFGQSFLRFPSPTHHPHYQLPSLLFFFFF